MISTLNLRPLVRAHALLCVSHFYKDIDVINNQNQSGIEMLKVKSIDVLEVIQWYVVT